MHTYYGIDLILGMRQLCSREIHPVQDHSTGEYHYMASRVNYSKIVTEMAPGQMGQRDLIMLLGDI